MDTVDYTRFILSLAFVIALIWLAAYLLRRSGLDKKLRGMTAASSRLKVEDVLYLDPRRKLVLVRADASEYLLLLAQESATLIDRLPKKDAA